jgi:hypothetical protein
MRSRPSDLSRRPRLNGLRTPLIGPRWTGGPSPQRRSTADVSSHVTLTSSLASAPANHKPPRVAPIAHPPAAQAFLQKDPAVLNITKIPFHLYKAFQTGPCFYVLNPELHSFHVQQPILNPLHVRPSSFTHIYV